MRTKNETRSLTRASSSFFPAVKKQSQLKPYYDLTLKLGKILDPLQKQNNIAIDALVDRLKISMDSIRGYLGCDPESLKPKKTLRSVKYIMDEIKCIAALKGKTITIAPHPDMIINLSQPATRTFVKAVLNVVDNAMKYANNICINVFINGEILCVTVSDNGPFIPKDILQNIFKPPYATSVFSSSTPTVRTPSIPMNLNLKWNTSWGMGLYLTVSLIQIMCEGQLTYSEKEGRKHIEVIMRRDNLDRQIKALIDFKLTFWVILYELHNLKNEVQILEEILESSLPKEHYLLKVLDDIKTAFNDFNSMVAGGNVEHIKKIPTFQVSADKVQIVLLDDDSINNTILKRKLVTLGIPPGNIFTFLSPDDALKHLEQYSAHLVFTDLNMPSMNGVAFAEKVLEHAEKSGKTPPNITLTSADDSPPAEVFSYVLKKPFQTNKLEHILCEQLISFTPPSKPKPEPAPQPTFAAIKSSL